MCTETQWFFVIPAVALFLFVLYFVSSVFTLGPWESGRSVLYNTSESRQSKFFFWMMLAAGVHGLGAVLGLFLPCGLETLLGLYRYVGLCFVYWYLATLIGLYQEYRRMLSTLGERVGRKRLFVTLAPYSVIAACVLIWWFT